ncbi:MAG: BirA family biotin operon repressor/biotin-[acetyl-CoA-carboxylase] ligase [Alphaproteobacteria bacterium]|jgi:BirA family biotin operon repressor/biotin-[acetyl-CoA-carboxylase] ligase
MSKTLSEFFTLTALGTVTSTNDEAMALAGSGAPEGTLITARAQNAGRGRRGRDWHSPEGNLYLSLILTPAAGMSDATAIGFAAALAARTAVAACLPGDPTQVEVKWPNDVLIEGAKVAGLLIEAVPGRAGALVLGLGINIAHHPVDTPYPATSVAAKGGHVSVEALRNAFCRDFLSLYAAYGCDGFTPLRADWLAHARGVGDPIRVNLEGARFDGTFKDIDAGGALVLDLGGGVVKKFTAGDVFFASI